MRAKTEERKVTMTPAEEDRFYGIDRDGNLSPQFRVADFGTIGVRYFPTEKRYILRDINSLKRRVSIAGLVSAWRNTGKYEWELAMASLFMKPLREAWDEGWDEVDITHLFEAEFNAWPTNRSDEKRKEIDGNTYRVLDQEDVKARVLQLFEIVGETDEAIYLKAKLA